jgi:hypothetical protein
MAIFLIINRPPVDGHWDGTVRAAGLGQWYPTQAKTRLEWGTQSLLAAAESRVIPSLAIASRLLGDDNRCFSGTGWLCRAYQLHSLVTGRYQCAHWSLDVSSPYSS